MATKGYKSRDTRSRQAKYEILSLFNKESAKKFIQAIRNKSEKRANIYESSVLKFLLFLKKDITELKKEDLDSFVIYEKKSGKSISNINRDLSAIRELIRYCINNDIIEDTPLKNYKNLKAEKEEHELILSGTPLSYKQLAQVTKILDNPESITTMECAIVWHLIYDMNIKNQVLVECCSERYVPSENKFITSYGEVILDEKHGKIMNDLLRRKEKDFGFSKYISDKLIRELGLMVGFHDLTFRDIVATKSEFSIKCPQCKQVYENNGENWVLVHQRIICKQCGENEKKKCKVIITSLVSKESELEPIVHPLMYDNFDSARSKVEFSINDLMKLQDFQKKIGSLGERYVLDKEIEKLKEKGIYPEYIGDSNVSAGFDILSYDESGNEIYIEVKSSVHVGSEFYLSAKEYRVAKEKGDRYYIYRVENVMGRNSKDLILTIYKDPLNNPNLKFEPHDWKVTANSSGMVER